MTTNKSSCSILILIPDSLIAVRTVDERAWWEATWTSTTDASILDEIGAHYDLRVERFVRRNVSKAKFKEWQQQHPRTFTTTREQNYLNGTPKNQEESP